MADSDTKRDYLMSDAELTAFAELTCSNITRDILEFTPYAVTPLLVTNLQTLCDAFEEFPSDDFYNMEYQAATEVKDNLIDEMKVIIRSMALRAEIKWGKSSPYYKNLGIADMSQLTDENFIARCRKIHKIMTESLSELSSGGLTQAMLDDMEDKIQALDDAKLAQGKKNVARTIKSIERVAKGNELYALVSKYCEIGKTIWYGVNSAKYNSYVIYSSPSPGALPAPTGVHFSLANMNVRWENIDNATSYIVSISSDGVDYSEVYSGSENFFVLEPTFYGEIYLTVKARNQNGFGPSSEPYIFYYYDVLPIPEGLNIVLIPGSTNMIRLTWQAVGSANVYKVYRCAVPTGMPLGELSYIAEQSNLMYEGAAIAGMRNWYAVKAANETQMSLTSDAVFLDIEAAPE